MRRMAAGPMGAVGGAGGARDAVLEIGAEEMPAGFLPAAVERMELDGARLLEEERVVFRCVRSYATPRRLALYVKEVAPVGRSLVREVRGPACDVAFDEAGAPTRAAQGFARAQGVRVEDLAVKEEARGKFVHAVLEEPGRDAKESLGRVFAELVAGLSFPKPMRWGDRDFRFARPIRWLLALWGDEVVHFEVDGIAADRLSSGHRFLACGMFELTRAEDYVERLRAAYCLVDQDERAEVISRGARDAARAAGGRLVDDPELLTELTYLAEHPVPLVGRFDPALLELPRDVIVRPMRDRQRYFPVEDEAGNLLAMFVSIRDGLASRLDAVRRGNERVLAARLKDARFFYDEDRKMPLEGYVPKLAGIVFHEQLGTMRDKVRRIVALASSVSDQLGMDESARRAVRRAAELCKADLATSMVREFPELQGVIGREYASLAGEGEEVALAILEHYLPKSAGDRLPESPAGVVLAIADRLDTLAGFFGLGVLPSGSEDPYALRRAIAGIVSILLGREVHLSVSWLVGRAFSAFEEGGAVRQRETDAADMVLDFLKQRLRAALVERGIRYDLSDAALGAGFDDMPDVLRRAEALAAASGTSEFDLAITGYTRAARITGEEDHGQVDPALLSEPAEKALFSAYRSVEGELATLVRRRDYGAGLCALSRLAEPIDVFFREVLVMSDDPGKRRNRLALLSRVAGLGRGIADLSRVVQSQSETR